MPNTLPESSLGSSWTSEMDSNGQALLLFALAPLSFVSPAKEKGERRQQSSSPFFPRTAMVLMQPLPLCWEQQGVQVSIWVHRAGLHCLLVLLRHWLHPSTPSAPQGMVLGSALLVQGVGTDWTQRHAKFQETQKHLLFSLIYLSYCLKLLFTTARFGCKRGWKK